MAFLLRDYMDEGESAPGEEKEEPTAYFGGERSARGLCSFEHLYQGLHAPA